MLTQKYTVTVRKPRVDLKYPQPAQLVCPLTILIAVKNPLPLSFTNQVSHSLSSTYSEDTNSKKAKNPNQKQKNQQNTTAHTPRTRP